MYWGGYSPVNSWQHASSLGRQPTSYTPQQKSKKTLTSLLFLSRSNVYLSMIFPLYPNDGLRPGLRRTVEEQCKLLMERQEESWLLLRDSFPYRGNQVRKQIKLTHKSKHCLALTHIFSYRIRTGRMASGGILSTRANEHPQSQVLVMLAFK